MPTGQQALLPFDLRVGTDLFVNAESACVRIAPTAEIAKPRGIASFIALSEAADVVPLEVVARRPGLLWRRIAMGVIERLNALVP